MKLILILISGLWGWEAPGEGSILNMQTSSRYGESVFAVEYIVSPLLMKIFSVSVCVSVCC